MEQWRTFTGIYCDQKRSMNLEDSTTPEAEKNSCEERVMHYDVTTAVEARDALPRTPVGEGSVL